MHERLVKPSNGGVGRGHERCGDDRSRHQIATQQLMICDKLFDRRKILRCENDRSRHQIATQKTDDL